MHLYICGCVYVLVHMKLSVFVVHVSIYTCVSVYLCLHVYVSVHVCNHTYGYICVYLFVFEYVSTDHFLFSYLSQNHHTALHLASQEGYNETVQLLLQQSADVNRLDRVRVVYI